jgi:RNA polymerase sigma factor (TIGR02999 family)
MILSSMILQKPPRPGFRKIMKVARMRSGLMSDATQILQQIEHGDPHAAEQLLPLIYDELRKLAAQKLAHEKPGQTLQATALVHEAYIRLVDTEKAQHWNSRGHFFAAAAEAMRRILVENARRKQAEKRRAGHAHVSLDSLDEVEPAMSPPGDDLLALNEALERLEKKDRSKADVVKLRFFAGLTIPQTASALGISTSTADNYWAYARAWLRTQLTADEAPRGG